MYVHPSRVNSSNLAPSVTRISFRSTMTTMNAYFHHYHCVLDHFLFHILNVGYIHYTSGLRILILQGVPKVSMHRGLCLPGPLCLSVTLSLDVRGRPLLGWATTHPVFLKNDLRMFSIHSSFAKGRLSDGKKKKTLSKNLGRHFA